MSLVHPTSPVKLHLGGEVDFKFAENMNDHYEIQQGQINQNNWRSSDPRIISVNTNSGTAKGQTEGKAEVYLDNSLHVTSFVHVQRISRIEIDESTRPVVVTNNPKDTSFQYNYRIVFNLYLEESHEKVSPIIYYNGQELIRQNIKFSCESKEPN